jgi:hypothetical protein
MKKIEFVVKPLTPEEQEEIQELAKKMAEETLKDFHYDPDKDPVIIRFNQKVKQILDEAELEYYRELFRQKRCWFWWW